MGTDYRKAKKHSALQQWTEKHMGHFCCYAFLHHLIIKRSIACNCLHLSQLLRKIKPPRFLPLQSWTVHKQVSDAVLSSFFSLPNTNYSAVVVVSTQKKKKKTKCPFTKKQQAPADGYSLRNWRADPWLWWGKSSPRTRCQDRLVKAMLEPREARPAFQVKCWLVDI